MFSPVEVIAAAYFAVFALALLLNAAMGVIAAVRAGLRARAPVTDPPFEPEIVVTLVHGTWARHAVWTLPGSVLRQSLSRAVDSRMTFQPFVWSGRNSISARRRGTRKLVGHLHSLIRRWPQARHYVVAHSHGGNVAFHALADPLLNEAIAGLVCLSTPFLTVGPRDLGPVGRTALWWLPVLIIFIGGMFGAQATTSINDTLGGVISLAVLPAAIAGGFLTARLLARLSTSVRESLQYPVVEAKRVLLLRAAGDEAAAVLGLTHAISWAAGRIWLLASYTLDRAIETVERWQEMLIHHWRLTALIAGCLLATCAVALLGPLPVDESAWLGALFVSAVVALLLMFATLVRGGLAAAWLGRMAIAAIAAPFLAVVAFLGIAVGPELLAAGLLFQVTAEPTPPGRWVVWQVAPSPEDGDARTGMMHSETYHNPQALQTLADWFANAQRELASQASI